MTASGYYGLGFVVEGSRWVTSVTRSCLLMIHP